MNLEAAVNQIPCEPQLSHYFGLLTDSLLSARNYRSTPIGSMAAWRPIPVVRTEMSRPGSRQNPQTLDRRGCAPKTTLRSISRYS
jgi:hypothetical protein